MRWETLLLLAALVISAGWAVFALNSRPDLVPEGAESIEVRVGSLAKGDLYAVPGGEADEATTYGLVFPGAEPHLMTAEQIREMFGPEVLSQLSDGASNWLFQLLNITTSASLAWVVIGILGQIAFFLRMTIQWAVSEKRKESVVPEVFWWLSFVGGVMLFSYFIWRRDIVGVLGQSTGVVIYARNIRLIHKKKHRTALAAASAAAGSPSTGTAPAG